MRDDAKGANDDDDDEPVMHNTATRTEHALKFLRRRRV